MDARQLGIDRRTVAARLASVPPDGRIRKAPAWFLATALRAMTKQGRSDDPEALDLTTERARREKAAADRLEMQNAVMRGELLPRADVDAAVIEDCSRVRARLLGIPSKVAPLVAATTEPREAARGWSRRRSMKPCRNYPIPRRSMPDWGHAPRSDAESLAGVRPAFCGVNPPQGCRCRCSRVPTADVL